MAWKGVSRSLRHRATLSVAQPVDENNLAALSPIAPALQRRRRQRRGSRAKKAACSSTQRPPQSKRSAPPPQPAGVGGVHGQGAREAACFGTQRPPQRRPWAAPASAAKQEHPGELAQTSGSTRGVLKGRLAMTYSPTARSCSTIGVRGLNFRVRNGIGWDPSTIVTSQKGTYGWGSTVSR